MSEVPGDPDSGDHLFLGIPHHRGFETSPPGRPGPSNAVGANMEAGQTVGIDRGNRDHFTLELEEVDHLPENDIGIHRPDPPEEFLQGGEVGDLIQFEELLNPGHQFKKFHDTPIICSQAFLEQDQGQILVPGLGLPGILAGIERDP